MPVVITDIQFAFAAAAFFADAGAPVIEAARARSPIELCRLDKTYQLRSLIYSTVFLGPAATILMLAYPAWETQYISPIFDNLAGQPLNAIPYGIFLMAVAMAAWFGHRLGFNWILAGKRKQLRLLYFAIVIISFAVFLLRWPAPVRVGSYSEFQRDPNSLPYFTEDRNFFYLFIGLLLLDAIPLVVEFVRIRLAVKQTRRQAAPANA